MTQEEIKVMMEQGTEAGVFEEAEHDIVKSIFKLSDRAGSALMKPRREVVWLDIDDSFIENQKAGVVAVLAVSGWAGQLIMFSASFRPKTCSPAVLPDQRWICKSTCASSCTRGLLALRP